jgi:hypothetical protein
MTYTVTAGTSLSRACGLARRGSLPATPFLGDGPILEYHQDGVYRNFVGHAFDHLRRRRDPDIAGSGRLLWKAYEKPIRYL